MDELEFYKLQASGNDFILVDATSRKVCAEKINYRKFAKIYCSRKFGIGADGVLIIEPYRRTLLKMRVFNSDGSEAEMCGNGARCAGLWANRKADGKLKPKRKKEEIFKFNTKAGIISVKAGRDKKTNEFAASGRIKIKMIDPFDLRFDLPLKILRRTMKVNYVNTGVPHVIVFVQGIDSINIEKIGREIRFHNKFAPQGVNVNFVEVESNCRIKIRTYERGVEGETLACGTGAVASSIVASRKLGSRAPKSRLKVITKGREVLEVCFDAAGNRIKDVWLCGEAHLIYKGVLNLV